jgi:hypothetical protein
MNDILKRSVLSLTIIVMLTKILFAGTSIFGLKQSLLGVYQYPYDASSLGRGGFSMGDIDTLSINQANFAQWAFLSQTIFVFNCDYHGLWSEIPNKTIYSSNFIFQGGFITIPVLQRKLVLGIGLTPFLSNKQNAIIKESSETHTIKINGNISEAKLVLAYAINSNFSFAAFTRYIMGKVTDTNARVYNETNNATVNFISRYKVYGIGFGAASFYRFSDRVSSGIQISFPAKITLETDETSNNPLAVVKSKGQIPLFFTVGLLYQMHDRWNIGMDLNFQNWKSGYKMTSHTVQDINNSYRIGAGVEYLPVKKRFISYLKRITYRAGAFFSKFNTRVNDHEVYEYGCAFGLGMPIGFSPNHLDISFELGNRGNLDTNLAREYFFKLHFTITANELWFIRTER